MLGVGGYGYSFRNPYSDAQAYLGSAGVSNPSVKADLLAGGQVTGGQVTTGARAASTASRTVGSAQGTEKTRECQTCKNRKYQDGSSENVSFKSAQHISAGAEASAVRAHEQEHVANAYSEAAGNSNKEVVSVGVTLKTAICPECGRAYVAGGETRTTMKTTSGNKQNPYEKQAQAQIGIATRGMNTDLFA